jgi:hypothetical protein
VVELPPLEMEKEEDNTTSNALTLAGTKTFFPNLPLRSSIGPSARLTDYTNWRKEVETKNKAVRNHISEATKGPNQEPTRHKPSHAGCSNWR